MQGLIKLITIVGPTGSGKSELAVFLAKQIKKHKWSGYKGAEIISADSRQVYKYLDVSTNKVPGSWQNSGSGTSGIFLYKKIQHHCIDFMHPRKAFSVAEFKQCAKRALMEISNRGNIPILAGGTGFYIQAVADDLQLPKVPPNLKLRKELEEKSTEELFAMLQKLDPDRALSIDAKNPRRLIRAIEICKATGKQIPQLRSKNEFQTLFIGIKTGDAELKKAIEKRSKKQIPGLLKEVHLLRKLKITKKRIRELGFEYRLAMKYLDTTGIPSASWRMIQHPQYGFRVKPGMTKKQLGEELAKENWRYAKRQMTWFKRDKRIKWITTKKDAERSVRIFLKN